MTENRRTVKNLMIKPKTQVKYIMYFLAIGMILLLVVFSFILYTLSGIFSSLNSMCGMDADIQQAVQRAIASSWVVFAVVFTAFAAVSVAVGLIVTHRLIGPMIPVRRMIDSLKSGDYKARGKLRDKDEFQEVMDDLNELAGILDNRHGGGGNAAQS